ncbi:hypothetical protein L3Q67_29855 [Saccharothrix sp. AJ9571]|nr:hypothetical protein L3Q67_29855 [Saccharothrix sp. AJ9571]
MPDGYEVVIGDIRKAAGAAKDAAEIAGSVDLQAAITPVGQAMAGSRSAQRANAVAQFWSKNLTDWKNGTTGYADGLTTAAGKYATSETLAAENLRGN